MTRHALEHTTNGGVKIVAALLQLPWLHHAWVFWVESSFGAITLMLLLKECMCQIKPCGYTMHETFWLKSSFWAYTCCSSRIAYVKSSLVATHPCLFEHVLMLGHLCLLHVFFCLTWEIKLYLKIKPIG